MIKALLKKQIWALKAFFTIGKNGKKRSVGVIVGFAALFLYGFGGMAVLFWLMAGELCAPLVAAGFGWVYFAFMATVATGFGIIGGVFMAKTQLYEAKDNDFLLSMPIPTWAILLSRMMGLYLLTFACETLVFAPALVKYYTVAGWSVTALFNGIVLLLVVPLGAMAICCLLGFLLAWITAKFPLKNLLTVLGFAGFTVVYIVLNNKMQEYLTYVMTHGEAVGKVMQTALYPFAKLGEAACGDVGALLLFGAMFGGVFALVYLILSATYLCIATMRHSGKRAKYKGEVGKIASPQAALFKREFLHFIKSPAYFLNASMGTIMMIIMSVMVFVKGDLFGLTSALNAVLGDTLALIVAIILCFMASSNMVSACSVSLEGESVWIVQSLPAETSKVFKSKIYLHFLLTAIPALVCGVVMGLIMELAWGWLFLLVAIALVCSMMFALMGLAINLKFPNLHWTNETQAVKQGLSSILAMFGGWGVSLLPLGGYFLFGKYLPAWSYALLWLALFALIALGLIIWLKRRGEKIFENL